MTNGTRSRGSTISFFYGWFLITCIVNDNVITNSPYETGGMQTKNEVEESSGNRFNADGEGSVVS